MGGRRCSLLAQGQRILGVRGPGLRLINQKSARHSRLGFGRNVVGREVGEINPAARAVTSNIGSAARREAGKMECRPTPSPSRPFGGNCPVKQTSGGPRTIPQVDILRKVSGACWGSARETAPSPRGAVARKSGQIRPRLARMWTRVGATGAFRHGGGAGFRISRARADPAHRPGRRTGSFRDREIRLRHVDKSRLQRFPSKSERSPGVET